MSNQCSCQENSNSGFVFGLFIGAIIGAIVAIIVYKNNKTEVFEKLQQKIKDFFQNLVGEEPKTVSPKKNNLKENHPVPVIAVSKKIKPAPKMFVKPKK